MEGKLIYICPPFEAAGAKMGKMDSEQVEAAEADQLDMAKRQCEYVLEHGDIPVAPHLWIQLLCQGGFRMPEKAISQFISRMVATCDELMVVGSRKTEFMEFEIQSAREALVSVRFCRDSRELRDEEEERRWSRIIRNDMEREGLFWKADRFDPGYDAYGDDSYDDEY